MKFRKLPSNSEQLLLALLQSDDPAEMLCVRFSNASHREDEELRGILRELREAGYVSIQWADNKPYFVVLNNSARTYHERLAEYEALQNDVLVQKKREAKPMVFISHRSTDKSIADMLADFLYATGIPRDAVFCSSLPGNDINERISAEVKTALKSSALNIAILSRDYYESAYCLNEAGVLWYRDDVTTIPIALPEINSRNMYGFLGNEYKLRRLNCETDISYIYDTVSEAVSAPQTRHAVITAEIQKLRNRYATFLDTREMPVQSPVVAPPISDLEITTDDERIVLYYIFKNTVRKVSKDVIIDWLKKSEIYGVNVDNAFDLLSSAAGGSVNGDVLEFGMEAFRNYLANIAAILPNLAACVNQHTILAVDTFKTLWSSGEMDSATKLFVVYITDERMRTLGDRWMAEGQIKDIKQWEDKNRIFPPLSEDYGSCLEFFVQNHLVYESNWTSYGNVKEYTLCPSLQEYLFNCPQVFSEELQGIKKEYYCDLPF